MADLLTASAGPLKVLWLSHVIPYPPKAGVLLRSYNLLRELCRYHQVDLMAFIQKPWIDTFFGDYETGLNESKAALREFCRDVEFMPIAKAIRPMGPQLTGIEALLTGSSYTTRWLYSGAARKRIAQRLASEPYDLVHFDTIGLISYRDLIAGLPTTLTHHNIESHMMLRRADNAGNPFARAYFRHEGRILRKAEIIAARKFSLHITCSELDSERLREIAPAINAVCIPNGVDCDYFKSSAAPQRKASLIFVGTMNWYPNIDAMMFFLNEVYPKLKQRVPALTLDIAGSNPPASITQLAAGLPGVTVHGYVPDVRPLIDSAAIFICPIRDGGGTKLKILDAFAMSKCVVAHPIACEGIEVTPNENAVFASEPEEFVSMIVSLLSDDERRHALGAHARALVEAHYSYAAIGREFAQTLTSLTANETRRA